MKHPTADAAKSATTRATEPTNQEEAGPERRSAAALAPEPSPTDPRVRRTRRALREALFELAVERDFGPITVRDIVERAGVNRNTFYLHYVSKDELLAEAQDTLFEEIVGEERAFADAHGVLQADQVPAPLVGLLRHVAARPELYRRLLGGGGSSAFAARLQAFHEAQFLRTWHDMGLVANPNSPPPELRARSAAATTQGVISWWLDPGQQESAETMAAWLWHLTRPLWFDGTSAGPDATAGPA